MTKIHLPSVNVISPSDLAVLIAQAVVPSRASLQGMECIRSRTAKADCPDPKNGGKLRLTTFPQFLKPSERALIEGQLAELPPVHGDMSIHQRDAFLRKFKRLNPKLDWVPVLEIGKDSELEQQSRELTRIAQLKAIRRAIETGEMMAVGAGHVPADHLGAVLPIKQVRKYLEHCCGFEVIDSRADAMQLFGKLSHRNTLDAAIDKAIRQCKGSLTLAVVWPVLKGMAMESLHGLSYDTEDVASGKLKLPKHTISYEGSDGSIEKLTRQALGKRLKRRAPKIKAASNKRP